MHAHNVAWQGSALRAVALGRQLVRRGHEVTVVAARADAGVAVHEERVEGLRLVQPPDVMPHRLRNGGLSPLDVAARLLRALRDEADVVHAFEPRPAATLPALLLRRRTHIPYLADWADLWGPDGMGAIWPPFERATLAPFDGWLQARTRRSADAVTAISSRLAARAVALGVPRERVRVIPVGCSNDLFRPGDAVEARSRLGLPADALVVVHTGFAPFDDHLLAETWARVARAEPRAVMLTSGRRIAELDRVAALCGSVHRVYQLGTLPYGSLGDVMAAGDVMVIPYASSPHNEARFPHRFGDYAAAGRPVVTNPTGDLGDVVEREGIGRLAPPTPDGMAAAVLALLHDPGACADLGRRARAFAEGPGSWSACAEALEDLYEELVGRSMSSS
jgi:glycosyltransferase involved in cell wall biosynthesis